MTITVKFQTPKILTSLRETNNILAVLKVAVLTIMVAATYLKDLTIIFNDAINNETTSYILVIPILFVYFIYRKRKMLTATIRARTENQPVNTRYVPVLTGVLLCITATILYWYGSFTFTPLEYHVLTLPILAAGLTLALFNYQTLRQALFPIVFLGFLTPPPLEILYSLGSTLSVISSETSTAIVKIFNIPALLTYDNGLPSIIITRPDSSAISFTVDIACSGIYSLVGFLIFAAFVAFIVRDKLWKKLLTFIIGFPLIYLLNVLRITTILVIGYQIGAELALDLFHLLGGWILVFLGTLVLLTISEKILKTHIFSGKKNTSSASEPQLPRKTETSSEICCKAEEHSYARPRKVDVAKIVAVILATLMLLSIQVPVFALTQSPAQILSQTPDGEQGNTQVLPNIPGYMIQFSYRDTSFEQAAKQDLSLIFTYSPQEEGLEPIQVALEIAETTASLHRWEYCLVAGPIIRGYQPKVTQLDLRDVQILDNPPMFARYFGFQTLSDNATQLVLYWYETSIFTINNVTQQKHVKLSLITYPEGPENIPYVEAQLLPVAKSLAAYWQPLKTWTLISMVLSQHGLTLTIATISFIVALAIFYSFELRKQIAANRTLYRKLSRQNQRLIDIILKVEKTACPTFGRIQRTYQEMTGETVTTLQLNQRIAELEKTGIIRSAIANDWDEPIRLWRVQTFFSLRKR